ncbi:transmembrane O-methyltransferase-like [Pundamilia nyererei]|uniref:catechol O-methyltransferase n=1 Tax=Pundamilia nyererei TaxID=303518 RepID=A0A9Y3R1W0_9CICH|nr:PREDICTED: transmembrane O-methyltransferase-like [Pundamilia nyererei]
MWLIALLVPLLPTIFMVSSLYCGIVSILCHQALAWALRLVGGEACVKSTHVFVFSNCTHGKGDSVLETFDLYAETHQSLCIGPQIGEILDDVVKSVRPLWVLELRMHCGYSSGRLLRLLPHGGRLITVVLDPVTADLGEEIILVAGFKQSQVQFLPSSAEAIPTLNSFSDGINLVLMDHDSQQYLLDLLALEREELLCPSGCTVLLNRGIKEPMISEESWITPEEESIPTASKQSIHL